MEDVPELASEYLVLTAPVLLLFFKGREVQHFSRFVKLEELHSLLERYTDWMDNGHFNPFHLEQLPLF
ncbi:thioredoxin family protein [Paenibacillus sp. J5C_2022]|uniref:thioredoxin family protein n=1 Tax=Paenibacillus sp. J5C2022 TaxID=2977129 RepID=UPI0021D2738C|nr:thioredoxin family protein [Paenibacillus sp. J5C2022]MCU6709130.1 thioredoxin family protein [Paenibacillus sp. J5C2022]